MELNMERVTLLASFFCGAAIGLRPQLDPCSSTQLQPLNDLSKRCITCLPLSTSERLCDDTIDTRWYSVGDLDMPTTTIPMSTCGTRFPIWLNGTIPNVADGIVKRKACIVGPVSTCQMAIDIRIKNCATFRIYELPSSSICPSAYCFDSSKISDPPPVFNSAIEVAVNEPANSKEALTFRCDVKYMPDYYYKFYWFKDGGLIDESPVRHKSEDNTYLLKEATVGGANIMLSCAVSARKSENGTASQLIRSPDFFVGFRVFTKTVYIERNDLNGAEVTIGATVPLQCRGFFSCYFELSHDTQRLSSQSWDVKRSEMCKIRFNSSSWRNNITFRIQVKANPGFNFDPSPRTLRFTMINGWDISPLWRDYVLAPITVIFYETNDIWKNKVCHALSDPHMQTFDKRKYENQYAGDFLLYKHNTLPIEVHMKTVRCRVYRRTVFCPCAVAVMVGRDVYVYSYCPGFKGYRSCDDDILEHSIKKDGSLHITLPTGTRVIVTGTTKVSATGSKDLFVYIYPSAKDINSTTGLCGSLNGRQSDDFKNRAGKTTDRVAFVNSWRLLRNETFFTMAPERLSHLEAWNKNLILCECPAGTKNTTSSADNNAFQCDARMYQDTSNLRKKSCCKSVKSYSKIIKRKKKKRSLPYRVKRYVPNAFNQTSARQYCESLLEQSPVFRSCSRLPSMSVDGAVNNCAFDLAATGDTDWANSALDSVARTCQSFISMNNTVYTTVNGTNITEVSTPGSDLDPELMDILAVICPNDCSGHGNCSNGTCICDVGFGSGDCANDLTIPPVIDVVYDDGVCDKANTNCDELILLGEGFIQSENLACRVQQIKIDVSGKNITSIIVETSAIFVSDFEVNCPVQNSMDAFAETYSLTVSNINSLYAPEVQAMVYNSDHQDIASGRKVTLKDSSCYIDDNFYFGGNVSATNASKSCVPSVSQLAWTDMADAATAQPSHSAGRTSNAIRGTTSRSDAGSRSTVTRSRGRSAAGKFKMLWSLILIALIFSV